MGREWQRRGWFACLLWPVSILLRLLTWLRRLAYARGWLASTRLPVPVVVVGNIFVGGTGKTPLTIWLVQSLQAAGWQPGVISRGHGAANAGDTSTEGNVVMEVLADSDPGLVGDEPLLIARRAACAVFVGRNRVEAGKALLKAHPSVNILISDDGLQHYALQRDVELMLFDTRGVGNGWLLPAGPLRESVRRRADFVVYNGPNAPPDAAPMWTQAPELFQMQLRAEMAENLLDPAMKQPLSRFAGRGLAAAGIGHPQRFFSMLREAQLEFDELPLPDHYAWQQNPFSPPFSAAASAMAGAKAVDDAKNGQGAEAKQGGDPETRGQHAAHGWILITEKDAVKCRQHPELKHDRRIWVVPVSAHIDAALAQHIVEKCRGFPIT